MWDRKKDSRSFIEAVPEQTLDPSQFKGYQGEELMKSITLLNEFKSRPGIPTPRVQKQGTNRIIEENKSAIEQAQKLILEGRQYMEGTKPEEEGSDSDPFEKGSDVSDGAARAEVQVLSHRAPITASMPRMPPEQAR